MIRETTYFHYNPSFLSLNPKYLQKNIRNRRFTASILLPPNETIESKVMEFLTTTNQVNLTLDFGVAVVHPGDLKTGMKPDPYVKKIGRSVADSKKNTTQAEIVSIHVNNQETTVTLDIENGYRMILKTYRGKYEVKDVMEYSESSGSEYF